MRKHGVRRLLSSIFGSHIDHDHSELIEGKEEAVQKVEKILRMIKTEEKQDDPAIGSELVSLVEELHENYKALYGKYDALLEKLKKHAHHKEEMNGGLSDAGTSSDSDSPSSDSDSSSKPQKKHRNHNRTEFAEEQISEEDLRDLKMQVEILRSRNLELDKEVASMLPQVGGKTVEDELAQKEAMVQKLEELGKTKESFKALEFAHEGLKMELEAVKLQHSNTSQRLRNSHEEKEALLSEKLQVENAVEMLKIEKGVSEEGTAKLQNENESLKQDLENVNNQVADLSSQLMNVNREKHELSMELATALSRISEADKAIGELKDEASGSLTLANEKSMENMQLLLENELLSQKVAAVDQQRNDLEKELAVVKEEKLSLISETSNVRAQLLEVETVCKKLRSGCGSLKDEACKLLSTNASLDAELRARDEELQAVSLSNSEAVEKLRVAEEQTDTLKADLNNLRDCKSQLLTDYEVLKQQKEAAMLKVSELQEMVDGMEKEQYALREDNAAVISERTSALNRLTDAKVLIEGLTAERDALNDVIAKLQDEILEIKLVNDAQAKQIDDLSGNLATMDEEKSMSLNRLSNIDKLVEGLKIERDSLNEDVVNLRDKIVVLNAELNSEIKKVADLGNQLLGANEEKQVLSLENVKITSKIEEGERTMNDLKIELQTNLELVNHKAMENTDLLAENESLKHELENQSKQITWLSEELNARKEDLSTLNDKFSKQELEAAEARKTIEGQMMDLQLLRESKSKLLVTVSDLEQKLRDKDEDNDALCRKYIESVNEYKSSEEQSQMLLKELKNQKKEMAQLLSDYEGMKEDFIASDNRVSELEDLLATMTEEKLELSSENATHLNKIEVLEKLADDLKIESEHLNHNNLELLVSINNLSRKVKEVEDEKSTLVAETSAKVVGMQCLQADLEKRLEERGDEVSALQKELAEPCVEMDLLQSQKNELEEQVAVLTDSLSEIKSLMQRVETELTTKLSGQEMALNVEKQKFEDLMAKHLLLSDEFQETCKKLETAQETIKELEVKAEVVSRLEMVGEEQKREIEVLGESYKETMERLKFLGVEKENANNEIRKLNGLIEMFEVQLCLSNKKLKISETEKEEKDKSYKKSIKELQEELEKSKGQVAGLEGKACHLETTLQQVKAALEKQLVKVGDLGLVLEGTLGLLHSKLFKCSEEIQAGRKRLEGLITKKEELENGNSEQLTRLKNMEGIVSIVKEEVENLQVKLALKIDEAENLAKSVEDYKERMLELQKKVKELEKETIFKDEEKREVIRQLCIRIEYHRENCEHLYHLLSPKLKGAKVQ